MIESYSYLFLSIFIVIFSGIPYLISWYYYKHENSYKTHFLVANRNLTVLQSSFAIAASWIWAPALFISSQQSYTNGWQGLLWFVVPNILCLILFAHYAEIVKIKYPDGFTLSDIMKTRYSNRVQLVYWVTLIGLTVCAFAVQLLAGGKLISTTLKIPFWISTIIIAIVPLGYSMRFGLRASVLTDFLKMVLLLSLSIILIPIVIYNAGGVSVVISGLTGVNRNYASIFSNDAVILMLTFGIPTTIGLISGPFGDQSFWQRTFAIQSGKVKQSFMYGAAIFSIVPLLMGIIGFVASGANIPIQHSSLVNIETLHTLVGDIGVIVFLIIVFSALTSIIDSKLCAVSSIIGHDLSDKYKLNSIKSSRVSMVVLTIFAILIANIPNLQILYLFLFYGTLRSSTFIITLLTLLEIPLLEKGVFYGILLGIFIGLPIFTFGNILNSPILIVTGSITTVLLPVITAKFLEYICK